MAQIRLVKDSRIIQINGKMLIASKRTMVGPTNSQATVRSDRLRTRRGTPNADWAPMRSTGRRDEGWRSSVCGGSGVCFAESAVSPER